jgi:ribose transport system ATP-binding protein
MIHPAIEMRGITKSFPGVKALKSVSFSAYPGEVHALAGENGAGKSTLMKILSGVYRLDGGAVVVGGEERHFTHPLEAIRAGIAVIYQEFSLLPERTVAQNIFLGREPTRFGLIDHRAMNAEALRVLALFGSSHRIEPDTVVADLDVASQQLVEIAKAVSLDAKVIVMDEPTAALNDAECEVLFGLVDTLKKRDVAIIYITHRMREITRLADRVTVLKDGETAAMFDHVPEPDTIVRAMVGRDIGDFYAAPATAEEIGDVVLSVRNASNDRLKSISFELHAGEIVGFAGLQGAGRVALAQAIFGFAPFYRRRGSACRQTGAIHQSARRHPRRYRPAAGRPQGRRAGADAVGFGQRFADGPRAFRPCGQGRCDAVYLRRRNGQAAARARCQGRQFFAGNQGALRW